MLLSWWKAGCIVAIDCQLQLAISGNCAKLSKNEIPCKMRALDMQSNVPFAFCEFQIRFILLVSVSLSRMENFLTFISEQNISRQVQTVLCTLHSALACAVRGAVEGWHEWSPMALGKANLTEFEYRMRPGLLDRKRELQLLALWQFGHLS